VPLEVTDACSVGNAVKGVDAVVHTAYARGGDMAPAVNAEAPAIVATACDASGVPMLHLSSDVVFGGHPPRPQGYRETDAVGPVEGFEYGRQKTDAERLVRMSFAEATIVRTTLLYDLRGGSSLEQAVVASTDTSNGMAHFTDEFRCPAHVDDVAAGIVDILELDATERPEVVHLGGPRRLSRADIAVALAGPLGIDAALLALAPSSSTAGDRPTDLAFDSSLAAGLIGYSPRPLPGL